jgi:hypothetical protein
VLLVAQVPQELKELKEFKELKGYLVHLVLLAPKVRRALSDPQARLRSVPMWITSPP